MQGRETVLRLNSAFCDTQDAGHETQLVVQQGEDRHATQKEKHVDA